MFQIHHYYESPEGLREFAQEIRTCLKKSPQAKVLMHVYNDTGQREITKNVIGELRAEIPEVDFIGCSTFGNICEGKYVDGEFPNITLCCDFYEDTDTHFEVFQIPLDEEHRVDTAKKILAITDERPWVTAVEVLTTIIDVSVCDFLEDVSKARDDIIFFGGGALCSETVDMYTGLPYVFSSKGEVSGHAIVLVLFGGKNLHVHTEAIVGWKPLGRLLEVTKAEGSVLKQLDGIPAFERYYHYLGIANDDSFSDHAALFPLAFDHNGEMMIKAPMRVNEDGSLALTSDVARSQKGCKIAYGDPGTILKSIKESAVKISAFSPQIIHAFSCASRLMYWGPEYINDETLPFESLAPVFGFYTGSEIMRYKGDVLQYNMTLVIVGMREGNPEASEIREIDINEAEFSRHMAIVNCLASFVGVTSDELRKAYDNMEFLAKHDGLTKLATRLEIETKMEQIIGESNAMLDKLGYPDETGEDVPEGVLPSIIMFDLDDFKRVNDRFGHKAGDIVLQTFGDVLKSKVDERGIGISGRWGGEEFMVVFPKCGMDDAQKVAQEIREEFCGIVFLASGRHTVSVGVAVAMPRESLDSLCLRVDEALYEAKGAGKNIVVVA